MPAGFDEVVQRWRNEPHAEARDKHLAAEFIARANELARPVLGFGSREMADIRKLEESFSTLR